MSHHDKVDLDDFRSRKSRLELEKAMSMARCPKDSKFGECLININTKQDPILGKSLTRIELDIRRMEYKMQQLRKTFVRSCQFLNYEPIILVERPPTLEAIRRKAFFKTYGCDPRYLKLPGYMYPMKSRSQTPTTLTTIDAFVVKQRRTRNVWEEAMGEKEAPRFKCTVRPCTRLTKRELLKLQIARSRHKLNIDDKEEQDVKRLDRNTPFITQLPRTDIPKTTDGRLSITDFPSNSKSLLLKEPVRKITLNTTPFFIT